MDQLLICDCRHSIVDHEMGRCAVAGCACIKSKAEIVDIVLAEERTAHASDGPAAAASSRQMEEREF